MKVWVAVWYDLEVDDKFVGVGETMEAAKKTTSMDGKAFWEDDSSGKMSKCSVHQLDHCGYKVFETEVTR